MCLCFFNNNKNTLPCKLPCTAPNKIQIKDHKMTIMVILVISYGYFVHNVFHVCFLGWICELHYSCEEIMLLPTIEDVVCMRFYFTYTTVGLLNTTTYAVVAAAGWGRFVCSAFQRVQTLELEQLSWCATFLGRGGIPFFMCFSLALLNIATQESKVLDQFIFVQ